jgi:hypothetical protein
LTSFGPGSQAANAFRDSLRNVATSFAAKDRCRADGLIADALLGVREIQVLYTPHSGKRGAQVHPLVNLRVSAARQKYPADDALSPSP